MGIETVAVAVGGAIVYGALGFLKTKGELSLDRFDATKILTTITAAAIGSVVLLLTGQEITAGNITTLLVANAGLAAVADSIVKAVKRRVVG